MLHTFPRNVLRNFGTPFDRKLLLRKLFTTPENTEVTKVVDDSCCFHDFLLVCACFLKPLRSRHIDKYEFLNAHLVSFLLIPFKFYLSVSSWWGSVHLSGLSESFFLEHQHKFYNIGLAVQNHFCKPHVLQFLIIKKYSFVWNKVNGEHLPATHLANTKRHDVTFALNLIV